MKLDRRRALGVLAGLPGAAMAAEAQAQAAPAFRHGVASGDPLTGKVVIWTRVSGLAGATEVDWVVAADPALAQVVRRGKASTDASLDYTVKADVGGLKPGREYFYGFRVGAAASPVGRTRTLPRANSEAPVVLAAVSCALYSAGLFNVYRAVADLERLDAVIHLGDYIYEYGGKPTDYGISQGEGLGRPPEPMHECVTLDDYRARHAQYKSDPDLQAAHARAPWIAVFDDHEIANDPWMGGAENHNEGEGTWADRKMAALKAYFEWMPIRWPRGARSLEQVNRSFQFGRVASLHMLETRLLARSRQLDYETDLMGPDGKPDLAAFNARLADPSRAMLGPAQLAQLGADLKRSVRHGATWQVLGNQVVMARVQGPDVMKAMGPEAVAAALARAEGRARARLQQMAGLFSLGVPMNLDAWDGYPAERERLYAVFAQAGARPVVLSGDSHTAWVNELHDAAGRRAAVEFGATAITSPAPSFDSIPGVDVKPVIVGQNPDVLYMETQKGFTLLTLTREDAIAELVRVSTIREKPFQTLPGKRFRVRPERAGVSAVEAL